MSESAKNSPEKLSPVKDAVVAFAKDLFAGIKPEAARLGTQGAMELASALFSGHGFVPYGPGQYTPSPEQEHGHDQGRSR